MFDITEQHDGGGGNDSGGEVVDAPPRSLSPRKPRTNVSTPEMRFHANLSLRKLSRVFTLPYRQAGFLGVTTHKRSSPLRSSPRCHPIYKRVRLTTPSKERNYHFEDRGP